MRLRGLPGTSLCALLLAGCAGRDTPSPASIRLVDLYRPDLVEARVPPAPASPRLEWRFTDAPAGDTRGWQAGVGVSGLALRNGRLVGRATGAVPILTVELAGLPESDTIHEVEVKLRVSDGGEASAALRGAGPVDFPFEADLVRVIPWPLTSPLVPGEEMRSYALRGAASVVTRGRRHLLLRPTDRAGSTFEIESVRLVTRREHLTAVPSGLGWHGLSEVYRESLVSRAPETIRFRLRLPERPRLELAVGSIEEWPVRFRVAASAGKGNEQTVAERLVTMADRWEPLTVDLERFAGREVALSLSLASEKPGTLGFWGSPVVRAAGARPPARNPGPTAQGVILIWADTLRRDHLDVYGYRRETAPAVRRLAAEGALFRDCVAQGSWTKVSGTSILTSLYPTTHGVADFPDRLPGAATTLAEAFREAGWATLALSSIGFVGKMTNLHQGFEEFHEGGALVERSGGPRTARALVDRLMPWLEAHRDVPFFVLLHVADPHSPFRPDPPYDTLWADPARREEHERQARAVRPFIANPNMRRFVMPTRDELLRAGVDPDGYAAYERDWYDGAIREMDAEIGRLRERLRDLGLEGQVVVAFTSDHGEEFLEHGRMFHGQSVYGEMTNVPLVFWGPGIVPAGLVVEGTVQTIDVMPTLLELGGLRPPSGIQGRSLAAAFGPGPSRGRVEPRPAIAEKPARSGAVPPAGVESVAIFSGGWKLIHNTKRPEGMPEFELYDHRADLLDRDDLAAGHPEVVARLTRELAAWRAVADRARLKPDSATAATLSKEELERLRALGYIQ